MRIETILLEGRTAREATYKGMRAVGRNTLEAMTLLMSVIGLKEHFATCLPTIEEYEKARPLIDRIFKRD